MNGQRLFEALLIAILTAGATGYTVTVRLEERVKIQMQQTELLTIEIRDLRSQMGAAKVQMGDRWTGEMQRRHERELYQMINGLMRDHETRGHK